MVRQPRVAVVTDSSSCIPRELQEECGIVVVPHQLITDGRVYRDGIEIEPRQFYQLLQRNGTIFTTSGPGPQAFLNAFQAAAAEGRDIICITVSPRFSATTYSSAQIAARMVRESHPEVDVTVLDSQAAAGGEGVIALEAARASQRGETLGEIVAGTEVLIPKVQLIAFLDTLHYLGKSGRIPKVTAWAGSILGFKPLTELSHGEARLMGRPRSRDKATEQLVSITLDRIGDHPAHVNVMHADAPNDAEDLKRRMEGLLDCREIFISEFTPVMGAHTGPGLLGLAFYSEG